MDETKIIEAAARSPVVEKTYDDALSPGLKELGKVGSDLIKTARLFLAPLQIAAAYQDRLERFLRELNERVPEERRIEVAAEIAGPALESMRYLDEQSALWKLFKELLFKASDRASVELVHPAFLQIIKQLTRDEAHLLFRLQKGEFQVVDTLDLNKETNRFENRTIELSAIPEDELEVKGAMSIYHAHLESLSLVEWPITRQDPIMENGVQLGVRRYSKISLTEFGRLFVAACVPPDYIE